MRSCSMSSEHYVPLTTPTKDLSHPKVVHYNHQDNQKTGIKFSIDEILKPSFGRCRTNLIKVEKGCIHINSESKPNCLRLNREEDKQDMSSYDDNDLGNSYMSDTVTYDRSIKQLMDISYLFNSHLANFQKQNVFYLPYSFHIGTQLHCMDQFGHCLPRLYARLLKNCENSELDLDQIQNDSRIKENTHLDYATITSNQTYEDVTERPIPNVSNDTSSNEIKFEKNDFERRKRINLNDYLPQSRETVLPREWKRSSSSTNFQEGRFYNKTAINAHGSSPSLQYDNSLHDNGSTIHHVTLSSKTCNGQVLRSTESNLKALPAWVFCTRYSDRPSSGPRYRKARQKTKSEIDKRPRTAFSSQQLQCLRLEFESSPYLCEKRRKHLSATLSLSESQVKIWFQNKRAKLKKRSGKKNDLALRLIEEGLYNHSTIVSDDCSDENCTSTVLS